MASRNQFLCAVILFGFSTVFASSFRVDMDSGEVIIIQKSTLASAAVQTTGTVGLGDSLIIASGSQAAIQLEDSSRLICKGPLNLMLSGENISLKIGLDGEGQVFLDRNKPYALGYIEIVTRGFTFRPIGTAAAVKTTKNGTPSSAVLEGKMNMQALNGETIVVEQGNFGAVDPNGKLVAEKLSPRAIEMLQKWVSSSPKRGKTADVATTPATDGAQVPAQSTQPAPVIAPQAQSAEPVPQTPSTTPVAEVKPEPVTSQSTKVEPAAAEQKPQSVKPEENKNTNNTTAPVTAGNSPAVAGGAADSKAQTTSGGQAKSDKPEGDKEKSKPTWEIGAGVVTVDNQQWTRIAFGVDVPIWKFGVFFDLELFVDNNGNISNKGWDFRDEPLEAVTRKIRYIRFGQESDPLYVKFGGLSSVTLGYGFLVDRFTNMLHYPDQKLLGLQFYLNDLTPIGLTLQTVIADFKDFKDDGGVFGARLAFKPLKMSPVPIINGITIGGTYATDLNQYAPARKWDIEISRSMSAYRFLRSLNVPEAEAIDSSRVFTGMDPIADSLRYSSEVNASKATEQFGLIGGDIGIPLIRSSLVNLDLYGQAGIRDDGKRGWGIGAPGLALKVWQLWASVEYRHVQGRFTPGYFGMYYLDERIIRNYTDVSALSGVRISVKEDRIPDDDLNGIFGKLGFNIANVLIIDGAYQYMVGKDRDNTDQRFEATSSVGDLILQKIPKISKLEAYFQKTEIGNYILKTDKDGTIQYDKFFEKTPFMYYGYRLGFKITEGASLIWDSRYGFKADKNGKMKENNFISVQTAITF